MIPTVRRRWFAVLYAMFALAGFVLPHSPTLAASNAAPRFYDGTAVATDGPTPDTRAWIALDGSNVYGVFIAEPSLDELSASGKSVRGTLESDVELIGLRLFGRLRRSRVSGSLFSADGHTAGSFRGTLSGARLSLTYTSSSFGDGTATANLVTRQAPALRGVGGRYFSPFLRTVSGELQVTLDARRGTFTLTGSYKGSVVATASGKWIASIAGNEGSLWLLASRTAYRRPAGFPVLALPRQGIPIKLGYGVERTGGKRTLILVDPLDRSTEIDRLRER